MRWYSPRDYVEEEVVDEAGAAVQRGELSARMKIPGNMWAEAWETARCVPARRQKRLFDDTKEAEKVGVCSAASTACPLKARRAGLHRLTSCFKIVT